MCVMPFFVCLIWRKKNQIRDCAFEVLEGVKKDIAWYFTCSSRSLTILLQRGDHRAMEFTHKLFKQIMWRSSKVHVADELHLPPQDECISWLTLSPVEEHFYQRQHETCVSYAHEVIERLRNHILKRGVEGWDFL